MQQWEVGDLVEILKNKGLLGAEIELIDYTKYDVNNLTNIYEINVREVGKNDEFTITIKEKYPDDYSIIFNF